MTKRLLAKLQFYLRISKTLYQILKFRILFATLMCGLQTSLYVYSATNGIKHNSWQNRDALYFATKREKCLSWQNKA